MSYSIPRQTLRGTRNSSAAEIRDTPEAFNGNAKDRVPAATGRDLWRGIVPATMHEVVGIPHAGPRFQPTELLSLIDQCVDDHYGAPVPYATGRFSRSAETENRSQLSTSRCKSPNTWSRTHPGKGSAGVCGENTWTGAVSPVALKRSFGSQSVLAAKCTRQASRELSRNCQFG